MGAKWNALSKLILSLGLNIDRITGDDCKSFLDILKADYVCNKVSRLLSCLPVLIIL